MRADAERFGAMDQLGGIHWHGALAEFRGEFDLNNAAEVYEELARKGPCIVDLSHVEFMDCRGLRALVRAHDEGHAVLVNPSRFLKHILDLLDLRQSLVQCPAHHQTGDRTLHLELAY